MPLRSTFSPFGSFFQRSQRYYSHSQWHTRFFHASATRRESPNHYKTLQVAFDASPAEIKKSFYILSKTYHPDRNPSDPQASQRFIEISEAYSVLGITAKRQQYDREFLTSPSSPPSSRPQGSYSSSGPVGGRPASGLRKRRTQFHGPPPSFYRSGGWGTHSAKRRAAQENGAPGAEAPNMGEEVGMGGMGPGQKPWGNWTDVPHFDREGHFRTHDNVDKRRLRRMEEGLEPADPGRGMLASFLFVAGLIGLGVFVPMLVFGQVTKRDRGKKGQN